MRSLTVVLMVALCAPMALADPNMVVVEDFSSYDLSGGPIQLHGLGTHYYAPSMWETQNNSGTNSPCTAQMVEAVDGVQAANLSNQDTRTTPPALSTVHAAIALPAASEITGQGTVYVRFKPDSVPNDFILCTNDLAAGWSTLGADPYFGLPVGSGAYTPQGAMVFVGYSGIFRARDGSPTNPSDSGVNNYQDDPAVPIPAGVWSEMWVQVDNANARSMYWTCPDGGTPTQVMNPTDGTGWWYHRNQTHANAAVYNIQFNLGLGDAAEHHVWIDTIAVDNTAFSTARFDGYQTIVIGPTLRADFDGDGDVDLDDFVILKTNFGISPPANGDADGDGDVDLDDFVILKTEFGS